MTQRPPIKCITEVRHMQHSSEVPIYLPHPSPNFTEGSRSAICCLVAQRLWNFSRFRFETFGIPKFFLKLVCINDRTMSNMVQISSRPFENTCRYWAPTTDHNLCLIVSNSAAYRSILLKSGTEFGPSTAEILHNITVNISQIAKVQSEGVPVFQVGAK